MRDAPSVAKILPGLILFTVFSLSSASALTLSVSAGCLFDVAPFGLEQKYYAVQAEVSGSEKVTAGFKSVLAYSEGSWILRFPVTASVDFWDDDHSFFRLNGYVGAGPEFYYSDDSWELSPVICGGIKLGYKLFFVDIPLASAFRDGDPDSDISLSAGAAWRW